MDIVMKISDVPTEKIMGIGDNVPSKPVIITSVTRLNVPKKARQSNSKTVNSKQEEK